MCGTGYSLTGRPCKKPKTYIYDEDEDDDLGGRGGKCSNENFSYLEQSNLKTWADKAEARKQMIRYRPCAKAIFKKLCSGCVHDTGCYQHNGKKYLKPATLPSECNYLKPRRHLWATSNDLKVLEICKRHSTSMTSNDTQSQSEHSISQSYWLFLLCIVVEERLLFSFNLSQ